MVSGFCTSFSTYFLKPSMLVFIVKSPEPVNVCFLQISVLLFTYNHLYLSKMIMAEMTFHK